MSRKCEKCEGATVKAQVQILQLPRVLVLQLKRLHMDRDIPCTKVCAPVNFSSQLDIGTCCILALSHLICPWYSFLKNES
jgi:ubiquitin carboxyl-terminal hydrolase 26/29/37